MSGEDHFMFKSNEFYYKLFFTKLSFQYHNRPWYEAGVTCERGQSQFYKFYFHIIVVTILFGDQIYKLYELQHSNKNSVNIPYLAV